MNNHTIIWMQNLQLFAEGGAGAAGTGEGGSDAGILPCAASLGRKLICAGVR